MDIAVALIYMLEKLVIKVFKVWKTYNSVLPLLENYKK